MKRVDWLTKVLLAVIAAGLWVVILRPVLAPGAVRAGSRREAGEIVVPPSGVLTFVTSEGKTAARLDVNSNGACLSICRPDGRPGVQLNGHGDIRLLNATGMPAARMVAAEEGGQLWLRSQSGEGAVVLTTRSDGGSVDVRCAGSKLLADMKGDRGGAALFLRRPDGEVGAKMDVRVDVSEIALYKGGLDSQVTLQALKDGAQSWLRNTASREQVVMCARGGDARVYAENSEGKEVPLRR